MAANTSPADWLTKAITQLAEVGLAPAGFAAYARLRFIPDPLVSGQHEADVVLTDDHLSDIEQSARVLRTLTTFTSTPDRCFFAVWDGYGEITPPGESETTFSLPDRRYCLFEGPVSDFDQWGRSREPWLGMPPAFVWPADRSWCFASDVDPHWASIGATDVAIRTLVAGSLDVVAGPRHEFPLHYS